MSENIQPTDTVEFAENFFAPLNAALDSLTATRSCNKHTDLDFATEGVLRVLAQARSGRDFLQQRLGLGSSDWMVSHYFKSLKSSRRGRLLNQLDAELESKLSGLLATNFASDEAMAYAAEVFTDYELFAGDGVYLEAAAHDPLKANNKGALVKWAAGHFYSLNLKTGSLRHLGAAEPGPFKKKEHDMHFLKRLRPAELRLGAARGKKVVHIWDRAGIDFRQWFDWKCKGIYMVSQEKTNMKLTVLGENKVDRSLPCNAGVISDQLVGSSCGVQLRRIVYRDPVEGTEYCFITNLGQGIPPGLVAWLYRRRWDIEKIFDQSKNRLEEKKSWASSPEARRAQGLLIAITHNLMVLLRVGLARRGELPIDKMEAKRRAGRAALARKKVRAEKQEIPFVLQVPQKPTQIGAKFYRWLRQVLRRRLAHREAIDLLAQTYMVFS